MFCLDVDIDVFQFDSHELGVDLEDAVAGRDKLELKKINRDTN